LKDPGVTTGTTLAPAIQDPYGKGKKRKKTEEKNKQTPLVLFWIPTEFFLFVSLFLASHNHHDITKTKTNNKKKNTV
jgi:hypothetical protein